MTDGSLTMQMVDGAVMHVIHENVRPEPVFKLSLKVGAKGQVQWELEFSGSDPDEVRRVIQEQHSILTTVYGGPGESESGAD